MARNLTRLLMWTLAFGALAAMVFAALRPRPVLVDVAEVQRGPMQVGIEDDGRTRIRERYVVTTPLTGRIRRVTHDVGDEVIAEETILARMEAKSSTLLDPRTVAQAKSRVGAAERKLQASKADLVRLESQLQFAETEMGRVRQLVGQRAASESEFLERELAFRQATEATKAAGFNVDIAKYELELERAALMLTDPSDADRETGEMELSIRAPIDGRILRIDQESSAVVEAGSPLMEIGDPRDLEVVADVLSRDAVRMRPGNPVVLRRWGGRHPLTGRVRLVEPSGFTKLSALGVEEQRVNVIIDLDDPPEEREELGDGFRVDCEVIVWESDEVLQVPTSALFRVQDQWRVFVDEGSTAREREVTVGQNNGRSAEVLAGLQEGETVIVHPGDSVENGVRVSAR